MLYSLEKCKFFISKKEDYSLVPDEKTGFPFTPKLCGTVPTLRLLVQNFKGFGSKYFKRTVLSFNLRFLVLLD